MVSIDRTVCRDILKMTTDYDVRVLFDPNAGGYSIWKGSYPEHAFLSSSVPISEVPGALSRLERDSRIKTFQKAYGGLWIFLITPELLHAKAFWWDRFSKTYLAGFISGAAATFAGGLLLHFFTGLF